MWKSTLIKNTADENICTVTSVWTDSAKNELFSYSEDRVIQTVAGINAFVTNAKNALATYQAKKNNLETMQTAIDNKLNT